MEQSKAVAVAQSNSLVHYQETMGLAEVFVKSGMFEDVKDVAQAAVKIMRGQELGFPPVTSMEVIDIVQKRLFLKPRAVGALINSCGYGSFEPLERTAERCVIQFRRRYRDGWRALPLVEYTIETAKARGLVTRTPEWKTDPANMLFWRCLGRGGAQYFPELLSGLQVAMDEEPVTDEQAEQNISELFGTTPGITNAVPPTSDAEEKQGQKDAPTQKSIKNDSGASHDISPGLREHFNSNIRNLVDSLNIDAKELQKAREKSYGCKWGEFTGAQLQHIIADLKGLKALHIPESNLPPFDPELSAQMDLEAQKGE